MTFQLKTWVMAAAIAMTSAAQATTVVAGVGETIELHGGVGAAPSINRSVEVTLQSARSTFFFSNGDADPSAPPPAKLISVGGVVGALNVSKSMPTPVDGAFMTVADLPVTWRLWPYRAIVNMASDVTGLVTDADTGVFSGVMGRGGVKLSAPFDPDLEAGGVVTVQNLRVDLLQGLVFADLSGAPLVSADLSAPVYGSEVIYSGAMWRIGSISGPTSLPPAAVLAGLDGDRSDLAELGYEWLTTKNLVVDGASVVQHTVRATSKLGALTVTDEGFAAFADALGMDEGGTGRATLAAANRYAAGWGTLKLDLVFNLVEGPKLPLPPAVTAVPEPEVFVLLCVGLLGVAGHARRSRVQ